MGEDNEIWLEKAIFDCQQKYGKKDPLIATERAKVFAIFKNQLFPNKVISQNGDAKILREIGSMDKGGNSLN